MNRAKLLAIFALRLKAAMKAKGMTQAELMRVTKMPRASISQCCTGKQFPRIEMLPDLADVLEVTIDYLLGD